VAQLIQPLVHLVPRAAALERAVHLVAVEVDAQVVLLAADVREIHADVVANVAEVGVSFDLVAVFLDGGAGEHACIGWVSAGLSV